MGETDRKTGALWALRGLVVAAIVLPLLVFIGGGWLAWRGTLREATASLLSNLTVSQEQATKVLDSDTGGSIAIETVLAGGLWLTRADADQPKTVLLNLAVNARDAMEGVRLIVDRGGIDLLFTGIGLPGGENGRTLADGARSVQPGLRVLFTTGYTRNAILHNGTLERGVHFIAKPFNLVVLAAKIREVLEVPASDSEIEAASPGTPVSDQASSRTVSG
jgi:DNA-binding NarL/FixJ family response regulator